MNKTNPTTTADPHHGSPHAGMTLIEILVVIVIIVVLLGIGVMGMTAVQRSQQMATARRVMKTMEAALTEYGAQVNGLVHYDGEGDPPDGISDPEDKSISFLIGRVVTIPEARTLLLMVEQAHWLDTSVGDFPKYGSIQAREVDAGVPRVIRDPWDRPYQYRSYHDGGPLTNLSQDGEVDAHGSANHPQPFFASAGPDKIFGTNDDLFSYNLE